MIYQPSKLTSSCTRPCCCCPRTHVFRSLGRRFTSSTSAGASYLDLPSFTSSTRKRNFKENSLPTVVPVGCSSMGLLKHLDAVLLLASSWNLFPSFGNELMIMNFLPVVML
ncbi:unnamed protein product [Amoebophrya sp. A120]|nr:unnamed protein product [Amoebophrya sp. A120]|eukprot:GSA120T00013680001.1